MPSYIVVATLTNEGAERLREDPSRIAATNAEAERLGAKIVRQYATIGEHDFITFIEAPDNITAVSIATEVSSLGTVRLHVYPAVAMDRFSQLLNLEPYRTEPHRWQTQLWARTLRQYSRHWVMTRHMKRLCQPFIVEGRENLEQLRDECVVIANHTSHIDTPTLLEALPSRIRERVAVAAAADRFYRRGKRGWWFSLFWNSYPIARGGGMKALEYSTWLLSHGWSILIYPEGGRFKAGEVQRFRHGPTILAMQAKVPVLPVYLEGLHALMPRGQRTPQPGPALVRFGEPLSLEGVASVPEGTERLRRAMLELAGLVREPAAEAAG